MSENDNFVPRILFLTDDAVALFSSSTVFEKGMEKRETEKKCPLKQIRVCAYVCFQMKDAYRVQTTVSELAHYNFIV